MTIQNASPPKTSDTNLITRNQRNWPVTFRGAPATTHNTKKNSDCCQGTKEFIRRHLHGALLKLHVKVALDVANPCSTRLPKSVISLMSVTPARPDADLSARGLDCVVGVYFGSVLRSYNRLYGWKVSAASSRQRFPDTQRHSRLRAWPKVGV